eukprot:s436_g28.t1
MTMMGTAEQYLQADTAVKVEEAVYKSLSEKVDGVHEAMDVALCNTMLKSSCTVLERGLLRRVLYPLVLALEGLLKHKDIESSSWNAINPQILEAAAGLGTLQTRYISERFRWSWTPQGD